MSTTTQVNGQQNTPKVVVSPLNVNQDEIRRQLAESEAKNKQLRELLRAGEYPRESVTEKYGPVIQLAWNFSFGPGKARAIVAHFEAIKAFALKHPASVEKAK